MNRSTRSELQAQVGIRSSSIQDFKQMISFFHAQLTFLYVLPPKLSYASYSSIHRLIKPLNVQSATDLTTNSQESRSEFRRSQFKRAVSHQPQDYKAWTGFKTKVFRVASTVVLPKNQRQCTPTMRPLAGTTRSKCRTPTGTVRMRAITEPSHSYEDDAELQDIDGRHADLSTDQDKTETNNFAIGVLYDKCLDRDATDGKDPPTAPICHGFQRRILLPNLDDNAIPEPVAACITDYSSQKKMKSKTVSIQTLPTISLIDEKRDLSFPATSKLLTTNLPEFDDIDADTGEITFEMLEKKGRFYDCRPPPLFMFLITIVEVGFFIFHTQTFLNDPNIGYITKYGPLPLDSILIYNPTKRYEVWRYFTYAFVHSGYMHIVNNILIQLALGVLLEIVHKWQRVLTIYFSGVLAGSLATSISHPYNYLAGASAGVYALIAAHLSTVILNWTEMGYPWIRVFIVSAFVIHDAGTALYHGENTNVGYAAHLGGAIAGLLVGICILRNFEWEKWENVLWYFSLVTCALIFTFAILWNIVMTDLFP